MCPEVSKPWATINRIMKRLARDGMITPIPRPKDQPYLYMPNPTLIHPQSSKTNHFLSLVDLYIRLGQPEIYEIEPDLKHSYSPDAYTRIDGKPVIIELQLSHISNKTMQEKINGFQKSHKEGKHDAVDLWVVTDRTFKVETPKGYNVEFHKWTTLKEAIQ